MGSQNCRFLRIREKLHVVILLAFKISDMVYSDIELMESTKRCLFPHDGASNPQSEERRNPGYDSKIKKYKDESVTSPTSVSAYPLQTSKQETITMSDDGAEVSIEFSRLSMSTPDKSKRIILRRANSLLDLATPSPTHTISINEEGSTLNVIDSPFSKGSEQSSQIRLQNSIAFCLGEPEEIDASAACNGWEAWSYCESEEPKDSSPLIEKKIPKNRAFSVEARRMRVKRLHQNLSPFNGSPKVSAETLIKSRSFSIMDHTSAIERVSKDKKKQRDTNGLTDVLQLCTMPENATVESPVIVRHLPTNWGEEDCYDSDPEDFARMRPRSRRNKRGSSNFFYPRRVVPSPNGKIQDIYNEDAFLMVSQEFVNTTFTLIFHASSPVAVQAWIERGQSFIHSLKQPKWMWKSKLCSNDNTRQNEDMLGINAVELLDITRVLKMDQIDRCRNPFAKPLHCFMLKTYRGEELIFEAESQAERDRLVFSMKMVIARFGAKVIGQDDTVYEEFFATDRIPGGVSFLNRARHV